MSIRGADGIQTLGEGILALEEAILNWKKAILVLGWSPSVRMLFSNVFSSTRMAFLVLPKGISSVTMPFSSVACHSLVLEWLL